MSDTNTEDDLRFREVRERLESVCDTKSKLRRILGVTQPAICQAYKARRIPKNWLIALLCVLSINPLWILYGNKYKKFLVQSDVPPEEENDKHK